MRDFEGTWCVIGGWAVDSWLGRQSREHPDVDIGIFRNDEATLFQYMSDWHLAAHDTPDATHDDQWDGSPLGFPAHIHARHADWPELDFNFSERLGDKLIVSRDPALAVSLDEAIRPSAWSVPTLAPELVLWHKAQGEIRPRDQTDFDALLPTLEVGQREWLASAPRLGDAHHQWLAHLG
jgi:hypothetical protein